MKIEEGYLGVEDVITRGWTRGLITQYLGHPDRMFPVNHWKNYSGKYAWRVSTVELAEMSQGFERSFLHSARIRRLYEYEIEDVIDRIYLLREVGLPASMTDREILSLPIAAPSGGLLVPPV